jgi:uncharacterized protein
MVNVKTYRLLELIGIFFLLPLWIASFANGRGLVFVLWFCAICAYIFLRKTYKFRFRPNWNWAAVNKLSMKPMLARFFLLAVLITAFTYLHDRAEFLRLITERPQVWVMIMFLYPVLSVVPQELLYRSFFTKRYYHLFPERSHMIIASALAFGWMHIVLHNWIAIVFCVIGGVFFTQTYLKHRSLALATIEHSLYGCFIFTIGLGWYFYHGRFG